MQLHDDTSRQVIDIAVGILIGLRGCSRRQAFSAWGELIRLGRTGPLAAAR